MKKVLFAAICVVLISSVAVAQDFPRAEIFAGYSLGRVGGDAGELYDAWDAMLEGGPDSFSSSQWFKMGFVGSAAFNVNEYFGIEAMFNFNSGTMAEFSDDSGLEGTDSVSGEQNAKLFAFMAGPRFTYRGSEAVTPFAHFLVGMNRLSLDYEASCSYEGGDCTEEFVDMVQSETDGLFFIEDSDVGFAFAVGGGLDVNVNESFAVRVIQVDFIKAFHGEGDDDFSLANLNLAFGAVFRVGN
ncbi:MAG: outer membrane beta-barrel protein [Acidobacteria bacterium]|nr:outer membrane beta-barrel protein [Acidobacteriota bacterium]